MSEGSERVEQLLTFVKTEFGEHLSTLLLSGFGDEQRGMIRHYAVRYRPGDEHRQAARVKTVAEDASGHPCRDEPLVLLALLKLLWSSAAPLEGKVGYTPATLLRMLGRPDTARARTGINQTVERYYNLSLEREEDLPSAAGGQPATRMLAQRLLIGYEHVEEASDNGDRRDEGWLAFYPDFVRALKERSLFGIDWGRVAAVERISLV
jgi:hypothetical protein